MEHEKNHAGWAKSSVGFWGAVVLLWTACGVWYVLPTDAGRVEQLYSRGVYRAIASIIVPVTERVPFSLAFAMIIAVPVLFLATWIGVWVHGRRAKQWSRWQGLCWGPRWLLLLIPLLWCWFLLFWGAGYGRLPVERRLYLDSQAVTEQELRRIGDGLLAVILKDQPVEAGDRNVSRAIRSVSQALFETVIAWEGRTATIPRRVKATLPGLLLMNGTSGVCAPFTLEPHVDGALPDTFFVAVGAHELGHIAGVCDEGETNLVGFVAGLRAGDAYARYCVALDIYLDVASQLGGETRKALLEKLPAQAHEDIRLAREASQRHRIELFQKWSWRVYNQYLKSQGVKEGVKSYGRGAQLLVKAWRAGLLKLPA